MARQKALQTTDSDNRPARGRGGKYNFPNARHKIADPSMVSDMLTQVYRAYKMPRVTSDDELMERIDQYITDCCDRGTYPTVEELALYTGYSIATLLDWEHERTRGLGNQTSRIIKRAKEIIKSLDAKMVLQGNIDIAAYCFRAKNYYGMRDQQDVIITPGNQLEQTATAEEIAAKYRELPPD